MSDPRIARVMNASEDECRHQLTEVANLIVAGIVLPDLSYVIDGAEMVKPLLARICQLYRIEKGITLDPKKTFDTYIEGVMKQLKQAVLDE